MDWRIDVASKNSCYWSASVPSDPNAAEVEECQRWKAELSRKLTESEAYDAIIVTQRAWRHAPKDANGDRSEDSMVQGLLGAWRTQTLRGTKIIAIRDNPIGDAGRAACVAQHLLLANQFCVLERARGLDTFDAQVPATEALLGSYLIDLSDYYCSPTECPPIIGNVVVYRDTNHITATFARTLAPILLAELREILG